MEVERTPKSIKPTISCHPFHLTTTCIFLLSLLFISFYFKESLYYSTSASFGSRGIFTSSNETVSDPTNTSSVFYNQDALLSKLRDSIFFLPLKDIGLADTPRSGTTWFMSSFTDTIEKDEAEYLYFPSESSKGRILCIKGHDTRNGARNSYALAWPEALPHSSTLLKGLTFVSDTYYDYVNLCHGLSAVSPFVSWSMSKDCLKPERWVLFHWGELRVGMGSWVQQLMQANFERDVVVEAFEGGEDKPYCFEKAAVMRHNLGQMGKEQRLKVYSQLRCKARKFCGISPEGRRKVEVNEMGEPIIRLTLFMRKGSRSFKNETAVTEIFESECRKVEGCVLKVVQSDSLSFCDQVRVMTETDTLASPHGAQLANMIFMNRESSVMEFFPPGWHEFAGVGQYVYHWMAAQSGMTHRGAWWEPLIEEKCPFPEKNKRCFSFYKGGKVGHNKTYFAEWAKNVLSQVRSGKLQQLNQSSVTGEDLYSSTCRC